MTHVKYEMNKNNTKNRMSITKTIHIRNNYNIMKRNGTEKIFYGPTSPMLPLQKVWPIPFFFSFFFLILTKILVKSPMIIKRNSVLTFNNTASDWPIQSNPDDTVMLTAPAKGGVLLYTVVVSLYVETLIRNFK